MRQVNAGDDDMDIDVVDTDTWGANTANAWNANAAHATDPADALDADTWEALQEIGPDQMEVPPLPPPPPELRSLTPPPNLLDNSSTNSQAQLTVDTFLYGSPGAQYRGPLQDHSDCQLQEHDAADALASIWAPFFSPCDWSIALWAKTQGPTSTTLMELLQIPEVRIFQTGLMISLTH